MYPFSMRDNPYDYATFEEVLLDESYNMATQFEPEFILDGGANIGLTSCYFASKYPKAKIVSVEPDNENFLLLKKNCGPYAAIHPVKAGIWKRNTYLKITNTGAGYNAFTVNETGKEDAGTIEGLQIDHLMYMYDMPRIDILKLDIEGSEKEIFMDEVGSWLPKTRVLVIELHDAMKRGCSRAVFNRINQYDFSFSIKGENVIFTNNAYR
jgi:FkbM family methyltransferase